jgi:transposase
MILDQFWLTDAQFSKIAPHLPTDTRGKARVDDRRVISGIVHVLKSGDAGSTRRRTMGPKKTLYNRYVRWAAKGVWVDLFHALSQAAGRPRRFSSTPQRGRRIARPAAATYGPPVLQRGRKIRSSVARAAGA